MRVILNHRRFANISLIICPRCPSFSSKTQYTQLFKLSQTISTKLDQKSELTAFSNVFLGEKPRFSRKMTKIEGENKQAEMTAKLIISAYSSAFTE